MKTYSSQFKLMEHLDNKLNNFITITGAVAALSLGIALFIFDRISYTNPYYFLLAILFIVYLGSMVSVMIIGLLSYKPAKYEWYPKDPERLVHEYSDPAEFPTETEVIRRVAGSLAHAAKLNREANARKAKACKRMFWLIIFGVLVIVIFAILMVLALGVQLPIAN